MISSWPCPTFQCTYLSHYRSAFSWAATCLPSCPDRAVALINVVPCLAPPSCLTLKNLWVMSTIWSLILSSLPHLAVKIQLHPHSEKKIIICQAQTSQHRAMRHNQKPKYLVRFVEGKYHFHGNCTGDSLTCINLLLWGVRVLLKDSCCQ